MSQFRWKALVAMMAGVMITLPVIGDQPVAPVDQETTHADESTDDEKGSFWMDQKL